VNTFRAHTHSAASVPGTHMHGIVLLLAHVLGTAAFAPMVRSAPRAAA